MTSPCPRPIPAMSPDKPPSRARRLCFAAVTMLAATVFMAWRGPAVAADEGPYPIWWSPVLELDSLDGVEQRLDRRLWKDNELGHEMEGQVDGRRLSAYANNCRALKKLHAEGFYFVTGGGYKLQLWHLAQCRAIELLGQARPARRSFVRDFVLDADALNSMPAPIDGPSCGFVCRQIYANDNAIPWSSFAVVDSVEVEEENTFKVLVYGSGWRVRLVGRADIDRDGIEDLLMIVDSWSTHGTGSSTWLFALTRDRRDAVLRILNPDEYRCASYQCKSSYTMPALDPNDKIEND